MAPKIEHPSATQYTFGDVGAFKMQKNARKLCLDAYFQPVGLAEALGENGNSNGFKCPETTEHGLNCKMKGVQIAPIKPIVR